jgi:hypothetical protein
VSAFGIWRCPEPMDKACRSLVEGDLNIYCLCSMLGLGKGIEFGRFVFVNLLFSDCDFEIMHYAVIETLKLFSLT